MITLNTILYEGNFDDFLVKNCWFFTLKSEFITNKLLTINNLTSINRFNKKIEELKKLYSFDIVYVSDHKESVNNIYNLNMVESTIGYFYTIPYFVAINTIKSDFILNVASDCMGDIFMDDNFLSLGMDEINNNPLCSTVMLPWVKDNQILANGVTIDQHEQKGTTDKSGSENFNYTKGFTDQFFMGNINKLKSIDYNLPLTYSSTYHGPSYGGNCFEKRMVANQNYENIYNCIFKGNQYYIHDNNYH